MTKRQTKKVVLVVAVLLVASMVLMGLVACNKPGSNVKQGTYRTYTTVMPSNWNELTYEDNNDTQILNYIVSSFFEYDYKFDEALGGKFKEDGTVSYMGQTFYYTQDGANVYVYYTKADADENKTEEADMKFKATGNKLVNEEEDEDGTKVTTTYKKK